MLTTILTKRPPPITPKKKIALRTIELKPKPKPVVKTIATPRKKPISRKTITSQVQKKKNLYTKLEKQLHELSKPIKKEEAGKITVLPKMLTPKSTHEEVKELTHTQYLEEILSLFHEQLELPEIGTVKTKVELSKEGKFLSCEILSTQSAKNAVYLQNNLPQLSYPPFNGSLITKERESFEITFRNAS